MTALLSIWKGPMQREKMADIATRVAISHGLSLADLRGSQTHRAVAWPRQQAFAEIYATGRYSLPQIGQFFGGRDHTTILHGTRRHAERTEAAA
jgi:chromosomal replication initiator protein